MSILSKIFGDPNQRTVDKYKPIVEEINALEPQFLGLSDEQLKEKTAEFRQRLNSGEPLDDLLAEAFAACREAAKRAIGQRHFDAQLIGGMVLHEGKIAEMKTGEGKTLAATLAAYLNALSGPPAGGVHVVTVNDYLSKRDTNWMGPVYHALGLSVGCIVHDRAYLFEPQSGPDKNEVTVEMQNLSEASRVQAYNADITYGTNNEFGFDYLRDNMVDSLDLMVQARGLRQTNTRTKADNDTDLHGQQKQMNMGINSHNFAIIDEVDSILIDEARTPLIISAPDAESTKLYETFSKIVPRLKKDEDYNIDEKMRAATLTEAGIEKVEKILGMDIYNEGGIRYVHHLEQALRAEVLFKRDRDYVVREGEVVIVDDFTGRLMFGRRYSEGLHQAIEAKEGVKVQQESRTLATITFQNYFRMYKKLAGMTGTALTSAEEFSKVYNLEVAAVPTNKPMIRQDLPDKIFRSENGKFLAVVSEIRERHKAGQPVLVGTVSIEKNEKLSAYLKKEGVPHQILNAKNHEQEAQIISQAGRLGAVTVATNMAGRGVDIKLGEGVVDIGGLHIIGTERHEARRIDNQLRGRGGRQGDLGSSQFFVSLEDDLMRIFGSDRMKRMMEVLKVPEDQPIENKMLSRAIESAQAKIEGFHFDTRKHVLEYDDVMNKQRQRIYSWRRKILEANINTGGSAEAKKDANSVIPAEAGIQDENWMPDQVQRDKEGDLRQEILKFVENEVRAIVQANTMGDSHEWNFQETHDAANAVFPLPNEALERIKEFDNTEDIVNYLIEAAHQAYEIKEKEFGEEAMRQIEKALMLRTIDIFWMDHLDNMDHLRDSVRLRAYGQKDPLVEYKNEGHRLFQGLLAAIESQVARMVYKVAMAEQTTDYRPRTTIRSSTDHGLQTTDNNSPQPPLTLRGGGSGSGQSSVDKHNIDRPAVAKANVGRNNPCWCGSGKKFKKCHGK